MNGFRTITREHGKVVHLTRRAGLHHQSRRGTQTFAHQMLVHGRQRQQSGNRHMVAIHLAVADDEDVMAALDGVHAFRTQGSEFGFDTFITPGQRVGDTQLVALELARGVLVDVAQPRHVVEVEHRLRHFQAHRRIHRVDVQQIRFGTDEGHQRHHDVFADGVDRRVGHLGEQLLEVVVERLVFVRQHGQRRIIAHGADTFFALLRHGAHQELDVFLRVAKSLLAVEQRL